MNKLLNQINKRMIQASHRIPLYGALSSIGFLSFYFVNIFLSKEPNSEDFFLRVIATLLTIPLIFFNKWPLFLNNIKAFYWNIALFYTQPFFFTYMLLKNSFDITWCLNGLISLTLIILVTDWISATILTCLGILAGCKYFLFEGHTIILPNSLGSILVSYIGIIIYVKLFVVKEANVNQEKIQSMKMLAGAIAHEMRTPLLTLTSIAERLKMHLSKLTGDSNNTQITVDKKASDLATAIPERIEKTVRGAFNIIDILLMNLRENDGDASSIKASMNTCIEKAIEDYALTETDKALIVWNKTDDFIFKGSPLLIKHVLFNLLKNALYYIKAANKGTIQIHTVTHKKYNYLHFKDTGQGIPASMIPHIFEKFYSKRTHGTGIGLAFCKGVMEALGGSIHCHSVEGEYAEFILKFPNP